MIQGQNLTFSHTGEPLYRGASFYVPKNKKVGLVGLNGSGKSTLFRLITKDEYPDDGKLIVEGSTILVPQEVSSDPIQSRSASIRDYLNHAKPQSDLLHHQLLSHMELTGLSLDQDPATLSGGQKTKLAILHAVLSNPDNLLLDEPTNFLDTAGKKWVMHWLSTYKKTLLVVSHDMSLLDQAISKVVYINKQTKKFEEYTGTYSKFKQLKTEHDQHLTRYIRNQEQHLKRMKKSLENLKRQTSDKGVRQRVQLSKRIQKIEEKLPELPQEVVRIKLKLPAPVHIGSLPVRVKHLSKSFSQNQVLTDVTFSVERGQKIALIGQNGAGKSTLIKIILNLLSPDSGTVELDEKAHIGYYSQGFDSFDQDSTLLDCVITNSPATQGQARAFLAKFMFGPDKVHQKIHSLSGGEKTRLAIATLMLKPHNLLILDEPTTYLDVLSQAIILEALKLYQGTILIVSHSPDFLRGLHPDRALLLPEEQLVYWKDPLLSRSAEM